MLCPSRIAWMAASSTTAGSGVSHTPWARFTPPTASHSTVMERISDCTMWGAISLRCRWFSVVGGMEHVYPNTRDRVKREACKSSTFNAHYFTLLRWKHGSEGSRRRDAQCLKNCARTKDEYRVLSILL